MTEKKGAYEVENTSRAPIARVGRIFPPRSVAKVQATADEAKALRGARTLTVRKVTKPKPKPKPEGGAS